MDRNERDIIGLVMVTHGLVHTYEMMIPLFIIDWLAEFDYIHLGIVQLDVTTATIGVIITIAYGLFGLGALPGGVLVDRLGSRRLIIACLFGMGTAYLLLGLAPNMVVIALAIMTWGLAASVYHPAGLSLISRAITNRGTGFAYHGMAGNVGIGMGPLIAAILLLFLEWRSVAFLFGLPAIVATIYAVSSSFDEKAAINEDHVEPSEDRYGGSVGSIKELPAQTKRLFSGGFLLVFVAVICSGLYYRGILTFLPELLQGFPGFEPIRIATVVPESLRGFISPGSSPPKTLEPQDYFYSGLLIIGLFGQYAGGKLTDKIQVEYGLGVAFGVLALLAIVFLPVSAIGIIPLIGLGAVLGVFLFVVQPMYQATVAEYTSPGTRGVSYGYTYLGVFGIGALGGGIAGSILAFATLSILFLTLASIALIGSLAGFYLALSRSP